jgi:hypothetical protein
MSLKFELAVEILKKTDKAIFASDGIVKAWIPLSLIEAEDEIEIGKTITISIPEWLGTDKGFV